MKYEVIREIFNQCSGNQMRDVDMVEVEIADLDAYVEQFRTGKDIEEERSVEEDGTVVYDLVVDGLKQRISFTEV